MNLTPRIPAPITVILIIQLISSGFGFCSHHHNHDEFEHDVIHQVQDHAFMDHCTNHESHTEHKDHDNESCRCDCNTQKIAIHETTTTLFLLKITSTPISIESIYKFEWIPLIYHPPLN